MSSVKVHLYSMKVCPYCIRAKQLLTKRGIQFTETVVSEDDADAWEKLEARSGMKTVPQIYHGDRLIGGFTDLAALDAKDQLTSMRG